MAETETYKKPKLKIINFEEEKSQHLNTPLRKNPTCKNCYLQTLIPKELQTKKYLNTPIPENSVEETSLECLCESNNQKCEIRQAAKRFCDDYKTEQHIYIQKLQSQITKQTGKQISIEEAAERYVKGPKKLCQRYSEIKKANQINHKQILSREAREKIIFSNPATYQKRKLALMQLRKTMEKEK